MKILFIVPYVPNLIRSRSYNLIRALAARGNEITLLTLWSTEQERQSAESIQRDCKETHLHYLARWRSYWNCLVALPTGQPLQAWYCWQPQLASQMVDLVNISNKRNYFDAVHVEHLRGVKYGLSLLEHFQAIRLTGDTAPKIIWDSVDSIALLFRQSSERSKKLLYRWLAQFELHRTEHFEAKMLDHFSRVLITSQKDKNAFLAYSHSDDAASRLVIIPNGVDLKYFHPDGNAPQLEDGIIVSGKMSYHANITMVMHLYEKIMPIVWSRYPQARLWVVGKDPAREIQAIGEHPNVTVTGTVDDIRPYIQGATVAVAPLVYGAGSQFKVLESMACGTPVVANPLAVSAFQVVPGQDVLVAEEPAEFADQMLRVLIDPSLRRNIGAAGRYYVERNHDWNLIGAQLEEVYHADS